MFIYNKVKIFTRFLKLDSDSSGKLSLHELLSLPELRNNTSFLEVGVEAWIGGVGAWITVEVSCGPGIDSSCVDEKPDLACLGG